jgi:hypothetical protein
MHVRMPPVSFAGELTSPMYANAYANSSGQPHTAGYARGHGNQSLTRYFTA